MMYDANHVEIHQLRSITTPRQVVCVSAARPTVRSCDGWIWTDNIKRSLGITSTWEITCSAWMVSLIICDTLFPSR
eukprot:scaffold23_cov175-Amphora_coffeaeformis.AAC.15